MKNTSMTVEQCQQNAEIASLIAELDEYFDADMYATRASNDSQKDSTVALISEIDGYYNADPMGSLIVEMDEYFDAGGIELYSDREDGYSNSVRRLHARFSAFK